MNPPIQYTKSGTIDIAYQVFGSGPVDLVYIPGWISNIDWMWACPELVSFFEALGKHARVILFDKRGTGLSDRVVAFSTLENRMEDIKAVMDATHSQKAILFGHSEGGSVSALFSATYPDRVHALIAFGIFAKRRYSPDYPWAPTDEERQKVYDMIAHNWGSGKMNLESLAPSKANDEQFMNWLASYFRSGASPKAAMQITKMNTAVDITGILEDIQVPTLLMQRSGDIDVKIEEGKFIAARIKNSKFVEFVGDDHLFWAGNIDEVLSEMISFIHTINPNLEPEPKAKHKTGLITILFGKIMNSSKNKFDRDRVSAFLGSFEGHIIDINATCFVAAFEGPGKAILCGTRLIKDFNSTTISSVLGIYMRQGYLKNENHLNEIDHYMIKAIYLQSHANQILVTQRVKHLLSGAAVDFIKTSSILGFESDILCQLFVIDSKEANSEVIHPVSPSIDNSTNESFLEQVLHIIEQHLEDSDFGVEMLTKKIGVSERQLQRKLKETTGKSPGQLITCIRLKRAKESLLFNRYTIAEIAFLCGFSSPSYFSKCFKRKFGVTPTAMQ